MIDPLKKLEEQKENYEEAFGNIFRRKYKQVGNFVQRINDGSGYLLNGNRVDKFFTDGSFFPYSDTMWNQKENIWVLNGKFNASTIYIKDKQISIEGEWYSGEFNGYEFYGNHSVFKGGTFHGQIYSAPNKSYQAGADNYYTGIYKDNKDGILGYDNINQEIDNNVTDVELVTIPVGWYVSLEDENGKKKSFQVSKRLDEKNTYFQFISIPNRTTINVAWETIRSDYLNKGFIVKGRPFNLFNVGKFGNITKIEIKQEMPLIVDFSAHDNLKKFLQIANVNVPFVVSPSSAESKKFTTQFLKDIPKSNGVFYKALKDLKTKIENGQVRGHDGFTYLYPVFNNLPGNKITDKETIEELKYLNNVIRYIGGDSVKIKAGNKSVNIQNKLINAIKKYLGIKKNLKSQNDSTDQTSNGKNSTKLNGNSDEKSSEEKKREFHNHMKDKFNNTAR